MIFAILCFIAFVIGAVVTLAGYSWYVSVAVASSLFLLQTFADLESQSNWLISIIFGLPIVFVSSLFGSYVVITRLYPEEEQDDQPENSNSDQLK